MSQWPRTQIEQELFVQQLEEHVARLTHIRQSLVIHSYREPSRQQWENKYRETLSGEPPIPPGMRLCWYDMRNGYIVQYGTAFDLQNGTASSGVVYPTVRNQNSSAIRLIGNVQIGAGRVTAGGLSIIGSNLITHFYRDLLFMDIFFFLDYTFVNDGTRFWMDFGSDVVMPELVTTSVNNSSQLYGRAIGGSLTAAQTFVNNFTQENVLIPLPEGPDAANGATQFPALLCHIHLMHPFRVLEESESITNVCGFGTVYHFPNNYGSGGSANDGGISHFSLQRLHPVKLGKDWRINFREDTSSDLVENITSLGWVYGYYKSPQMSAREFTNVV